MALLVIVALFARTLSNPSQVANRQKLKLVGFCAFQSGSATNKSRLARGRKDSVKSPDHSNWATYIVNSRD